MHAKTGGIIPEEAARQQVKSIIPVVSEALNKAKIDHTELDAIAVTYGPGLIGSLLVGIETAKTLADVWKKPIIPVNHLIAHMYANFISENSKLPLFPALALVVSGGHTDLVLMKTHGKIEWIGGTLDDAAGEAFDKTARLLGLPYPGGPSISKSAEEFITKNPDTPLKLFPRPLIGEKGFNWSFSGLKTAVNRYITSKDKVSKEQIAAEVQEAIVDVLVKKTLKAIDRYHPRSILLAGGVAANGRLRTKFQNELKNSETKLFIPEPKLCTDNGAVIASCAFFNREEVYWEKITANPELTISDQ